MITKNRTAPWLMAIGILLSCIQCWGVETQADIDKRICVNLAEEARYVLDDNSDTTKYLSPYIAAEIYQQVITKSLGLNPTDQSELLATSMAALPCGDIVSSFLMAIKRRMEYNRFDYFVMRYRSWIVGALLLAALVGVFYARQRCSLVKQSDGGAAT